MIIYITNHAASLWNEKGWSQGHCDVELSPRGHDQAMAMTLHPALQRVRRIVTSDLQRARQTAEPLCHHLGLVASEDRQLREWNMPNYHRDPAYPPLPFPGGFETLDDLRRRARMALDRLAETPGDSPLLVVTHSAFLRCFLETLDSRVARDFKAIQTAINTLEYNAGAWSIVQLNDGQ